MLSLVLDDPVTYVKRGGSNGLAHLAPSHPIWVCFAKAMMPIASLTAKRTAAYFATQRELPSTVLDVAAGHGLYGIELAKILPRALVTAVDWSDVLALAHENAKDAVSVIGSAWSQATLLRWIGGATSISCLWRTSCIISAGMSALRFCEK